MDTTFFKEVDGFGVVDTEYQIKSVTTDVKKGLRQLIERWYAYTVPVQYCHFHQVATITRYTTKTLGAECGKALRLLILKLKDLNFNDFSEQFQNLKTEYKDFLKEKNGQGNFSHHNLGRAIRSVQSNLHYLFSFEKYPNLNIP